MIVNAYDAHGRHLPHEVNAGDAIDHKRKGTPGIFHCLVIDCKEATHQLTIRPLTHDGKPTSNRERTIVTRGVLAVYAPGGARKSPAAPGRGQ